MEIKQLEYFVTAVDCGSLNQASQQLYTTQPNVSRVLAGLEKELCTELLVRSSKGIRMTPQGELLYGHAMNILKHTNIIRSMTGKQHAPRFSVSGYRSSILAKILTEIYMEDCVKDEQIQDVPMKGIQSKGVQIQDKNVRNMKLKSEDPEFMEKETVEFEYHEGTVEEITDNVAEHLSEIGIVYFAEKQMKCFQHIMEHKKLKFYLLDRRRFCIYMGKNHPLYGRESLEFSELKKLKFVGEVQDFFAMEHHIESVSVGEFTSEHMEQIFTTNSDYVIHNLLLHSDVCCMGIEFVSSDYQKSEIRGIPVEGCEPFLAIGYVASEKMELSVYARRYLEKLKQYLKTL